MGDKMFDVMVVMVAGVVAFLVSGAQADPCPSYIAPIHLTSTGGVTALTDAMNCTGPGVYEVTLQGRLKIEQTIQVSAQKNVTVTGTGATASNDDADAVIDAGNKTGIFSVSNGANLILENLMLAGGNSYHGGAVSVRNSSVFRAVHCEFTNNRASIAGGAIFADHSEVYIYNGSTLTGNSAEVGGAVYSYASNVAVNGFNITFSNNTASTSGGAIFANRSVVYMDHHEYVTIRPEYYWGSWQLQDLEVNVDELSIMFINNTASTYGGAVHSCDSNVNFCGGFSYNEASTFGGAIYSDGDTMSSCQWATIFYRNVAKSGGGAIYTTTPTEVNVTHVMFVGNTADVGGAIYMDSPKGINQTVFQECVFHGNSAIYGGAFFFSAETETVVVSDSSFDSNIASISGGAIYFTGSLSLLDSDFWVNTAGEGGLAITSTHVLSSVEFKSVVFYENYLYCQPGSYQPWTFEEGASVFGKVCQGCSAVANTLPGGVNDLFDQWRLPVCVKPPEGTIALFSGTTTKTLTLEKGYYRHDINSDDIAECFRPKSCVGGDDLFQYCATGYEGAYCSICSKGYFLGVGYSCRKCSRDEKILAAGATLIVVAAVFIAVCLMLRRLGRVVDVTEKEGQHIPQGFVGRKCSSVMVLLTKALPLAAIKIVVVVWQIVSQFSAVVQDVYPKEYEQFLSYLSVVNFDISVVMSYSCLFSPNFYGRLHVMTITPLAVLAALAISYSVAKRRYRRDPQKRQAVRSRHLSAAVFVVFFVYSSVSSTIFRTFNCELTGAGLSLKADYSVECSGKKFRVYVIYAGVMALVYPIGIPALVGWWLVRNRKNIKRSNRQMIVHLQPFSGVWGTYRPTRYYYELVEYGRRLTLSVVSVFLAPNSVDHIAIVLSLAVVFLFVSESLSPFERSVDMSLYRWGNGVVLASMYVALLMKSKESEGELGWQSVFGWVLIAANIVMIVAVVVEAVILGSSLKGLVPGVEEVNPPVRRPTLVRSRDIRLVHPTQR